MTTKRDNLPDVVMVMAERHLSIPTTRGNHYVPDGITASDWAVALRRKDRALLKVERASSGKAKTAYEVKYRLEMAAYRASLRRWARWCEEHGEIVT